MCTHMLQICFKYASYEIEVEKCTPLCMYQSGCISLGAHSVFKAVFTSQAKTKALSLIFTDFPEYGSFSIKNGLTERVLINN